MMQQLLLCLVVATTLVAGENLCHLPQGDSHRIDCHPDPGASDASCNARQCCWVMPSPGSPKGVPACYYPRAYPPYSADLKNLASSSNMQSVTITKKPSRPFHFSKDILNLKVEATYETSRRGRIRIVDPVNKRWEVPIELGDRDNVGKDSVDQALFEIHLENDVNGTFGMWVQRKDNEAVIFDTRIHSAPLIYTDQFLQLTTRVTGDYVFGLGETRRSFARSTDQWTENAFYARDVGVCTNCNMYGVHNFMLATDPETGLSYGIFMLNSNAQEVVVQPGPLMTYRTIGGVLDFFFFVGDNPAQVIQEYWKLIGTPMLPPEWALGFHLSRYGWDTLDRTREVYERNAAAGMPMDGLWSDIEYMDRKRDWTIDHNTFNGLAEFSKKVRHTDGRHYIFIVDPAIALVKNKGEYPAYDWGKDADVYIKGEDGVSDLVAEVWPGTTVYPDFTNNATTEWWTKCTKDFYNQVEFDGLWIDMNEPSSFVPGSIYGCGKDEESRRLNNPPYVPDIVGNSLIDKTICASSRQALGRHYDLHSLYGYHEAIATRKALEELFPKKRPFILSRSTFAGSGRYAFHWSGDNTATWDDMYYSLSLVMNFNMFGIPFTGPDICGFNGQADEELCTRWMQLGAFYPFMRNHNTVKMRDQDPASWSQWTQDRMREAIKRRYELIPYIYTKFFESAQLQKLVFQPLFFEFPKGGAELQKIDWQFMLGDAIMVAPVLAPGRHKQHAVFPLNTAWCTLPNNLEEEREYRAERAESVTETIDSNLAKGAPAWVRGGRAIVMQGVGANNLKNAEQYRAAPLTIYSCTDAKGDAKGQLYSDGQASEAAYKGAVPERYNDIRITTTKNSIELLPQQNDNITRVIERIELLGVVDKPTTIKLTMDGGVQKEVSTFKFRNGNNLLIELDEPLSIANTIKITW